MKGENTYTEAFTWWNRLSRDEKFAFAELNHLKRIDLSMGQIIETYKCARNEHLGRQYVVRISSFPDTNHDEANKWWFSLPHYGKMAFYNGWCHECGNLSYPSTLDLWKTYTSNPHPHKKETPFESATFASNEVLRYQYPLGQRKTVHASNVLVQHWSFDESDEDIVRLVKYMADLALKNGITEEQLKTIIPATLFMLNEKRTLTDIVISC